jgi:hypothetical protein
MSQGALFPPRPTIPDLEYTGEACSRTFVGMTACLAHHVAHVHMSRRPQSTTYRTRVRTNHEIMATNLRSWTDGTILVFYFFST